MNISNLITPALLVILAAAFLALFFSIIKTHVHIHINRKSERGKYVITIENIDDISSTDKVRIDLKIRGPGRFERHDGTNPAYIQCLGFAPWPAGLLANFEARTAVITADGLDRHERWSFEVFTSPEAQGIEVHCRIGKRQLPTIASDSTQEYTDNPNTSPATAWIGVALTPLLYLAIVANYRKYSGEKLWLEPIDAIFFLLIILLASVGYWVALNPRQTIVAFPNNRPAFPPPPESPYTSPPLNKKQTSPWRKIVSLFAKRHSRK
ncbi:hypothetical protein [Corallococcus macrosporus]|uniref:hypothetical protein n=1 Tax=Corallococcus macrosporus TaxID=35 RepID=UPI000F4F0613|nr:hypothetical protein [Corallococcus macrosporus]